MEKMSETEKIPLLLEEWKQVEFQIEELFKKRDSQNILVLMKKGIDLFIQFLFWSNDKKVVSIEPNTSIPVEYKPVNIEERLTFIQARPSLYHSYRQLSELMSEQEKLFVKKKIMKKASKPRG